MAEKQNSNAPVNFDLYACLRDVFRQWPTILLITLAVMLILYSFQVLTYTPSYTASTTFIVKQSGISANPIYDNLNAADTMTKNFIAVLSSRIMEDRVCQALDLASFDATVQVSSVESSNLMTLHLTADTPQLTYSMIHSVMDTATEICGELSTSITVQVLQAPSIPVRPNVILNPSQILSNGFIIGIVLAVLLVGFLSLKRDTIRNERDLKQKVDASSLGTIRHEEKFKTLRSKVKRPQISMLIDNPTLSFGYVEGIRMVATRTRREMDKGNCQVALVTSVGENEGKSTVAANLALALSREGAKVALLDCDFYKPALYKIFRIKASEMNGSDLSAALREHSPVKLCRTGLGKRLMVGFTTVPITKQLRQKDLDYLKQVIALLREKLDYIIIDSAPFGLVPESESLANLCDCSILVVQQHMVEARQINDTIDALNETQGKIIGCIFSNVRTAPWKNYRDGYGYIYGYGYGHYGYGYGYGYGKKKSGSKEVDPNE